MNLEVIPHCPQSLGPSSRAKAEDCSIDESGRDSQSPLSSSTPSYPPTPSMAGTYANLGALCAIVGLFVLPEILCSAAIILGAYAWKREQGNRGLYIVILGIVCMLVGLYFTALFLLGDLLPS